MSREQINSSWDSFCQAFLPEKPNGFSLDKHLFRADISEETPKTCNYTRPEDRFIKMEMNQKEFFLKKESIECSETKLKELTDFLNSDDIRFALGYTPSSETDPFFVVKDFKTTEKRDIWFLGDIHGDIFALRSALAFINSNSTNKPIFVFLGDLFDRNLFSLNVLTEVVSLIKDDPESVLWITGNHDEGLFFRDGRFSSTVTPHQFSEYLNLVDVSYINDFVQAVISLIKMLPVGLVLPNGLLAVHGGIPTRPLRTVQNVWEGVSPDKIPAMLREKRHEFACNRFDGNAMGGTKIRDYFSWLELINFSFAIEAAYGIKISNCLRGHDHCTLSRHEWLQNNLKEDKVPQQEKRERIKRVLTFTTMTIVDPGEKVLFQSKTYSYPSVAKWIPSETCPRVFSLMFNEDELEPITLFSNKTYEEEKIRFIRKRKAELQRVSRELNDEYEKAKQEEKPIEDEVNKLRSEYECAKMKEEEALNARKPLEARINEKQRAKDRSKHDNLHNMKGRKSYEDKRNSDKDSPDSALLAEYDEKEKIYKQASDLREEKESLYQRKNKEYEEVKKKREQQASKVNEIEAKIRECNAHLPPEDAPTSDENFPDDATDLENKDSRNMGALV